MPARGRRVCAAPAQLHVSLSFGEGQMFGNAFGHHISLLLKQMAPLNSSVVHEFLFTCLERPLGFPLPECCLRPSLCHHIQPPDSGVQQPRARLRSVSSPAGLEPSLSHVIGIPGLAEMGDAREGDQHAVAPPQHALPSFQLKSFQRVPLIVMLIQPLTDNSSWVPLKMLDRSGIEQKRL